MGAKVTGEEPPSLLLLATKRAQATLIGPSGNALKVASGIKPKVLKLLSPDSRGWLLCTCRPTQNFWPSSKPPINYTRRSVGRFSPQTTWSSSSNGGGRHPTLEGWEALLTPPTSSACIATWLTILRRAVMLLGGGRTKLWTLEVYWRMRRDDAATCVLLLCIRVNIDGGYTYNAQSTMKHRP